MAQRDGIGMGFKGATLGFEGLKGIKIFLVDDDDSIAWGIESELRSMGAEVRRAATLRQALATFPAFEADIAISDINLPDGNGLELLKKWRKEDPSMPIILITAHGEVDSAIAALRFGAFDYLQKPFAMQDLAAAVKRAAEVGSLRRKVKLYEGKEKSKEPFTIVGDSLSMKNLRFKLERIAKSKADTVIVYGESGSGKELAARAVHEWSSVASEPFVEINCASIPEALLESELFGYEKGAFTDARERKIGLLEIARGGSVFLDEIGEMPLKLQAKLLRVLEYRRFKRLGGTKDIEFAGRIIAATNRQLEEEITEGRFREDLYYRINAIPVFVPPLRARRDDIPALVEYLLGKICANFAIPIPNISDAALELLATHSWRGNVRELKNVLQRSLVFNQPATINPDDLELYDFISSPQQNVHTYKIENPPKTESQKTTTIVSEVAPKAAPTLSNEAGLFILPEGGISLEEVEKNLLEQALERTKNNQSKACRLLGISRHTLRYRLEKFGFLETGADL